MGAHLGGGSVQGGTLAVRRTTAWRFDGDGTCVEIPYSESRIPSRACVRSYPVHEQDGLVLFWFHAGGADPTYEVPTFDEAHDDAWSSPHEFRAEMVASLQDMAENNVDYTHFRFVHGRDAPTTGRRRSSRPTARSRPSWSASRHTTSSFTRYTYGPGVALLRIPALVTLLTTTTPIDRRHVRLLWHFYFPPGRRGTRRRGHRRRRRRPRAAGRPAHLARQGVPGAPAAGEGRRPDRRVPPLVRAVLRGQPLTISRRW